MYKHMQPEKQADVSRDTSIAIIMRIDFDDQGREDVFPCYLECAYTVAKSTSIIKL